MREITETAAAKVNLFLHIKGRADNGYHHLESLVVFTAYGDEIQFRPATEFNFSVVGPFAEALQGDENIVYRTVRLFSVASGTEPAVDICLKKNLPVGAGIGGGSADAAATLRALQRYTKTKLDDETLSEICLKLGADVPVCLRSGPSIMTGIGDQVTVLDNFPQLAVLLANPGVHVDTGQVFGALNHAQCPKRPAFSPQNFDYSSLLSALRKTGNDLIAPATKVAPVIGDVCRDMAIGDHHGLSGSGATGFALFRTLNEAQAAATELRQRQPTWWIKTSTIRTTPV